MNYLPICITVLLLHIFSDTVSSGTGFHDDADNKSPKNKSEKKGIGSKLSKIMYVIGGPTPPYGGWNGSASGYGYGSTPNTEGTGYGINYTTGTVYGSTPNDTYYGSQYGYGTAHQPPYSAALTGHGPPHSYQYPNAPYPPPPNPLHTFPSAPYPTHSYPPYLNPPPHNSIYPSPYSAPSAPYPPHPNPSYTPTAPYPPPPNPSYSAASLPPYTPQHNQSYPYSTPMSHTQHQSHMTHGYGAPGYAHPAGNPTIRPNPYFNPSHTASMLREAMRGLGSDKNMLIRALIQCSNAQRQHVPAVFKQMYGKDLFRELNSELYLHTHFKELVMALMEHPSVYDAKQLNRAMDRIGTKENVLIEIMTTRSNAQIHEIKAIYRQKYGRELETDMIGDTSGYFRRLLIGLCAGNRDESWQTNLALAQQDAYRLYRAGEGRLGTDEIAFQAVLATQNLAQLRLIFDAYRKLTNHSIEQAINAEFSGDIRKANLAIVKSVQNRPAFFAEQFHKAMEGLGTRDNDLIRLVVTRSELDLADIRQSYQQMFGVPLERAIAGDTSGSYEDGLIAIVRGHI